MSTQPSTLADVQPDGFFTRSLAEADPAVFASVAHELERERTQIELIASENIVSKAVLAAQGSVFTNKYAEGYPGKRYYQGCAPSDEVERLAIDRAKRIFGCGFANVQPHSGAQANGAVMLALVKPGRHDHGHEPRCRRPPYAWREGGDERQVVRRGPVRRACGRSQDRLRRGRAAGEGAPSQAHHRGRLGLSPPQSTSRASVPSRTKSVPISWSTWRISQGSSRRGCIQRRSATRMS